MTCDIFISYRRDGGDMFAHILYEKLTERGYRVFQDVESLRSGKFNTGIYDKIDECKDFLLILPPNALDRCKNEDDWVRQEAVYALKKGKNIIPIMLKGFSWPEKMPEGMEEIAFFNGITPNAEFFEQSIDKLVGFLISKRAAGKSDAYNRRHKIRFFAVLVVAAVILSYPLIDVFVLGGEFTFAERVCYFAVLIFGAYLLINQIQTKPSVASACVGTITEDDIAETPDVVFSRVTGVFGKNILVSREAPEGFESYYKLKRLEFGSWDGKRVNYLKLDFKIKLEWYDPSIFYLYPHSWGGNAVKMLTRQNFVLQTPPRDVAEDVDFLTKNDMRVFLKYKGKRLCRLVLYQCSDEEFRLKYKELGA